MVRIGTLHLRLVAAVLMMLAVFGGFGLARAGAGPSISVSSVNSHVGDLAKIDVKANNMPTLGLAAWTINLDYDPALVTMLSCMPGSNSLCNIHYDENTVRITGTNVFGLPGQSQLASIGLTCASAGDGSLELSTSVLADATIGDPRPINATMENGSAHCKAAGGPTATEPPQATATPPGSEPKLPGDANCDGTVDSIDAAVILQYAAGIIGSIGCPDDGDFDHDAEIDSVDAALVLQKAAGLF